MELSSSSVAILVACILAAAGTDQGRSHQATTSCSPGNSSSAVSPQDLKRNYRLDSVKDDILRKLRMDSPPNVNGSLPNIPAMQTLLRQMEPAGLNPAQSDLPDIDHVSPATFILLSQQIPAEKQIRIPNTCYFRFSQDLKDEQSLVSAHLGIYIRDWASVPPASTRGGPATLILIYVISRSAGTNRLEKTLHRRRRIHLTPADMGKWYFFDVKTLADNWTQNEDRNLGIQIYAQDLNGDPVAVLPTQNETVNSVRPYIEIQVEPRTGGVGGLGGASSRPRRSADSTDCDETGSERRCCRYPLRIDFDAFRWDWVVAPKYYDAYYCSGECPILFYQRHLHTHVQSQGQGQGQGQGQVQGVSAVPCCAPTVMSPLQILYFNPNGNLILGTMPDMIVERCGCS